MGYSFYTAGTEAKGPYVFNQSVASNLFKTDQLFSFEITHLAMFLKVLGNPSVANFCHYPSTQHDYFRIIL